MKVFELMNNIRITKGKSLSLFMNMSDEASIEAQQEAKQAFMVYLNNGLMELSKSFNVFSSVISLAVSDPNSIVIHDPKVIGISGVVYNGEELDIKEFSEQNRGYWFHVNGIGSISVSPQLMGETIYVGYYKLVGRVTDIEDEIPINEIFLNSLEKYILKEVTGVMGGQEEENVRGLSYRGWIDSIEELERMGYQRTSYVGFNLTNEQKGWLEW